MEGVFFRRNFGDAYGSTAGKQQHRRSVRSNRILGAKNNLLPSSAIVELATSFRAAHFLLLARGPKYVPTCQSYFATDNVEDVIRREYEQMSTVIMKCLADNCVQGGDSRLQDFMTPPDST